MSLSIDLSQEDLAVLCEQMPIGVILHQDKKIRFVNPAMLKVLGYREQSELLGRSPTELVHPDQQAAVAERLRANQAGGISKPLEERLLRRDGSFAYVEVSGVPVQCGGRDAVMALFRDLSQNRAMDQEAKENAARFKAIFESGMAAQAIVDDGGKVIAANQAMAELLGLDPERVLGSHLGEFPVDPEHFMQGWQKGLAAGVMHQEDKFHRRGGPRFPGTWTCRANVLPGQHFLAVVDRSAQALMEDSLRQAQKMEAVGQLAGGVAHDFNNVLTVIMGNCQLLLERRDLHPEMVERLGEMLNACESAAAMTRQLLTFSRGRSREKKVLDLSYQTLMTKNLLARLLPEPIRLELDLDEEPAWVDIDPCQVEQLLLNLSVNARDAMPHGGKLCLRTRHVDLVEGDLVKAMGLAPGPYAVLSVRDNGQGMSEAVLARIFEPFFTTKGPGKGTGLGLATVFGIAKEAGGAVRVLSVPGEGSLFEVYLPRVAQAPRQLEPEPLAAFKSQGGHERILLVEDEPALRRMLGRALEGEGYEVVAAQNGTQALEMMARAESRPAAVISDMVMPGMSGPEFLKALEQAHGIHRAILISGYQDPCSQGEPTGVPPENFFQKPMRLEKLLTRLREILDREAA